MILRSPLGGRDPLRQHLFCIRLAWKMSVMLRACTHVIDTATHVTGDRLGAFLMNTRGEAQGYGSDKVSGIGGLEAR